MSNIQNSSPSSSTQNRALSAVLFLYWEVFLKPMELVTLSSAKCPEPLPTV